MASRHRQTDPLHRRPLPPRNPLLVALLALFVVAAGCGVGAGGTPSPQQIHDNAAHSKMRDAKIALSGTLNTSASGIAVGLTLSGNGAIELKPASASRLTLAIVLTGQLLSGTLNADIIEVGGQEYSKVSVNIPDLPFPNPGSDKYSVASVPADQAVPFPTSVSNLKLAGEEVIRGDKCWHLTGSVLTNASGTPVASGTPGARTVHVDEWVREKDYYYVRIRLDALPGFSLPLTESTTTATPGSTSASAANGFFLDFSDYDRGVTISQPPADQIAAG